MFVAGDFYLRLSGIRIKCEFWTEVILIILNVLLGIIGNPQDFISLFRCVSLVACIVILLSNKFHIVFFLAKNILSTFFLLTINILSTFFSKFFIRASLNKAWLDSEIFEEVSVLLVRLALLLHDRLGGCVVDHLLLLHLDGDNLRADAAQTLDMSRAGDPDLGDAGLRLEAEDLRDQEGLFICDGATNIGSLLDDVFLGSALLHRPCDLRHGEGVGQKAGDSRLLALLHGARAIDLDGLGKVLGVDGQRLAHDALRVLGLAADDGLGDLLLLGVQGQNRHAPINLTLPFLAPHCPLDGGGGVTAGDTAGVGVGVTELDCVRALQLQRRGRT